MPSPFRKFSDKRKEKKARKAAKAAAVSETYSLGNAPTPVAPDLKSSPIENVPISQTSSFDTSTADARNSSTAQTIPIAKSETIQWYGASDLYRAIETSPTTSTKQAQGTIPSKLPSSSSPPAVIRNIPSGVDYSHWDDQRRLEFAAKFNALSPIFDGVDGSVWHKAICSDVISPTSPSAYRGSVTWGKAHRKPIGEREDEACGQNEFSSGLNYN